MGLLLALRKPNTGTALDIRASVGTSTSPTTPSSKAVTGVPFEPKVVMPWSVGLPVGTAASQQGPFGFGCGVSSSNRSAIGVQSQSGVTTSNTERSHTNAKILSIPLLDSTSDFLASDLDSLDSGGFTLNWSTVEATARILNHICLGGADLEVSLTQHQMNGTNAAQSFSHGLSGAPTGLLFFGTGDNTAAPNTTTFALMALGGWSLGNQWCASVNSQSGVTTTATRRMLYNSGVLLGGTSVISRVMAVSSVDSINVNATYPVSGSAFDQRFYMLAIRGAKCQTGTFDCNGSLSPLTINTPGITPKLFLPIFIPLGVDLINTVQNNLNFAIGASDGTNSVMCGITEQNGVSTTNARRFQSSSSLSEYDFNGTLSFVASASFLGETVVLDPSTNAATTWGQGCYFVVGA